MWVATAISSTSRKLGIASALGRPITTCGAIERMRFRSLNHLASLKGLPESLAVCHLGERLAPLLALAGGLRRIAERENGQHLQGIRDAQGRLDLSQPSEPDPVRADPF